MSLWQKLSSFGLNEMFFEMFTFATSNSCYYIQLLLGFPAKQGNCFAQISHFSHSVCRKKFEIFRRNTIMRKNEYLKKFRKIVAYFFLLTKFCIICASFCKIRFREKMKNFSKKFANYEFFCVWNFAFFAKVFVRWLP